MSLQTKPVSGFFGFQINQKLLSYTVFLHRSYYLVYISVFVGQEIYCAEITIYFSIHKEFPKDFQPAIGTFVLFTCLSVMQKTQNTEFSQGHMRWIE